MKPLRTNQDGCVAIMVRKTSDGSVIVVFPTEPRRSGTHYAAWSHSVGWHSVDIGFIKRSSNAPQKVGNAVALHLAGIMQQKLDIRERITDEMLEVFNTRAAQLTD